MRERLFRAEPLCRACGALGEVKAAEEMDHVVCASTGRSVEAIDRLLLDEQNIQPLCRACHKVKSMAEQHARHNNKTGRRKRKWQFPDV